MANHIRLEDRAVLAVSGEDARPFLQGLLSNDVRRIGGGDAVHAALLTPQGRYLFDFFVVARGDALWLDCEAARRAALRKRLAMYRMRARVAIDEIPDEDVYAVIGRGAAEGATRIEGGVSFADPRLSALGMRAIVGRRSASALAAAGLRPAARSAYDMLRIGLGVPDGSRDLIESRSLLLENGFDALNGVDFEKGCYVGQEVTARMKHRNLVRRRLVPVAFDGAAPSPGTPVRSGGAVVGEIRSSIGEIGLALLRLEAIASPQALEAGGAGLAVRRPGWADY